MEPSKEVHAYVNDSDTENKHGLAVEDLVAVDHCQCGK
jgi:hypothetical protein